MVQPAGQTVGEVLRYHGCEESAEHRSRLTPSGHLISYIEPLHRSPEDQHLFLNEAV